MGNDQPQTSPTDSLRRLSAAVGMAQAMKAVTADAPFSCPLSRKRISSSSLRQRCMKSSVKCCYLWNAWQDLFDRVYTLQSCRVVKRSQLCQLVDCLLNVRSDHHGGRVPVAAVDNAM